MPSSFTGSSVAEVPSADRPDTETSGSTTTSVARCSARRRSCSACSRGCAMARPASVSSTASCRLGARRICSQPAASMRRQEARRLGYPRPAPVPAQYPVWPLAPDVSHRGQPSQSAPVAAAATDGGRSPLSRCQSSLLKTRACRRSRSASTCSSIVEPGYPCKARPYQKFIMAEAFRQRLDVTCSVLVKIDIPDFFFSFLRQQLIAE